VSKKKWRMTNSVHCRMRDVSKINKVRIAPMTRKKSDV